jgi:hypothetical protein
MLSVADLVLASGLVSINIQWEEVAADVKKPDFKIELEFVPLPDRRTAEVLAVLPTACLLTAPPERQNTY